MDSRPVDCGSLRVLLDRTVSLHSDRTLLAFDDRQLTYGEFYDEVLRSARALHELGVAKGDRVAMLVPNSPDFLVTWMAAAHLGAVPAPMNIQLKARSISGQVDQIGASAVVVDESLLTSIDPSSLSHQPHLLTTRNRSSASGPGGVEPSRAGGAGGGDRAGWLDLDELSSAQEPQPVPVDVEPSDLGAIIFSSGTTGLPKGVAGYQHTYLSSAADCAAIMGLDQDDRIYCCLPLFHGNPQLMAFLPVLAVGASMVVAQRFSASQFWDDTRRYGATGFTYVGTMLQIIVKQDERPDDSSNPVEFCFGGGATPELYRTMLDRFGVELIECYGLIESGGVVTSTVRGATEAEGCGPPRSCFEVAILDANDQPLPVGEQGEIAVRPRVPFSQSSGYYENPQATLDLCRNLWMHTGDVGRLDERGWIHFVGREKDSIRRRGENISATEVEHVLERHPAIAEVAVVAVPDDLSGEEIKACIVVAEGRELDPADVWEFASSELADFMVPRYLEVVDKFEKTGSQRVLKAPLRATGPTGAHDRMAKAEGR